MNPITATPLEAKELSRPYSDEEALSAFKLGLAIGISEAGILPSDFERMLKFAEVNILGVGAGLVDGLAKATLVGGAAGTLLGGYSGFLRHRAEKAIEGKNDPDIVALQNKIRAYKQMTSDLDRTNRITGI